MLMLGYAWNIFLTFVVAVFVYGIYKISRILIEPFISPIRDLPGPPSTSWLSGHSNSLFEIGIFEDWVRTYGHTIRFKSILNVRV